MKYSVMYSATSYKDLRHIAEYMELLASNSVAIDIITRLVEVIESLNELPLRGHSVPELSQIGVTGYKEIHYGAYRIIYFIHKKKVIITAILDARRDAKEELERRILNP